MKIWKLISGIISCVAFIIVAFQSCATGVVNAIEDNSTDTSASGGIWGAFILLVAGITSACVWKVKSRSADMGLVFLFGLAAFVGFSNLGVYGDLEIWSWWAAICMCMAFVSLCLPRKKEDKQMSDKEV